MTVDGGGRISVSNKFSGEVVSELSVASSIDVEASLQCIHEIALRRKHIPAWKRVEILERAGAAILADRDRLAMQIAIEGGKPLQDALVEVDRAAQSTRLAGQVLIGERGQEVPMDLSAAGQGRLACTRRIPIGPVVAVSAFNHPLNLIAHQVAPAVAADCPVIVKPSLATPLSCLEYVRILREAGWPEDRCEVILASNEDAEALVTDSRVAFFSFIGSARVGWFLRSKLAAGTRCALEHGGVAPVVVAEDADLDLAAQAITKGGFYHAGQVCVSVQRVFAVGHTAEALAEKLCASVAELRTGDPTKPATDVGPLIASREVKRVGQWVDAACEEGATLLCGGAPVGETCFAATVLMDPPEDSQIATQEVFGPVVSIFRCAALADAIARANSVEASFQSAVFARDLDTALDVADRLNGSAVMVNDHTAFRVDWMPFAGLGPSGLGTGGILGTFEDMTIEKMTVIRRQPSAALTGAT